MTALIVAPDPEMAARHREVVAVVVGTDGSVTDLGWLDELSARRAEVLVIHPTHDAPSAPLPLSPFAGTDAIDMYAALHRCAERAQSETRRCLAWLDDALSEAGLRHRLIDVPLRHRVWPGRRAHLRAAHSVVGAACAAGATSLVVAGELEFGPELEEIATKTSLSPVAEEFRSVRSLWTDLGGSD